MQKGISVQYPYRRQAGASGVGNVGVAHVPAMAGAAGSGAMGGLLDAAIKAGGGLTEILAGEWRGRRTAEVDDVLLGVDQEFEQWKQEYRASNRGALAANAGRDFAARYGELAEAALKDFGHEGEVFHDALKARLAGHALLALRDGGSHQAREMEVWKSSQLAGQLAAFSAMAAENPLDEDAISHERRQLMAAWELKNPGQDARAFALRLNREAARARIEAMLADPAMHEQAGQMLRRGYAPDAAGRAGPKPGSLSEAALAANNFGFVKGADGKFASYASRSDGLAAIGGRFLRYANAPERGWHARTLEQAMSIYAPASDGNDLKAYLAHLEQLTGFRRDQELDFRNPETLAKIIAAIPRHEHGAFVEIGPQEALLAAQKALAGDIRQGRPADPLAGLSASEREHYGQLLQKRRTQAAEAAVLEQLQARMAGSSKASPARRLLDLFDHVSGIADPAMRDVARRAGLAQLKYENERQAAARQVEAEGLLQDMQAMNPLDAARYLRESKASPEAIDLARKTYFANEGRETVENRRWTSTGREAIDAGGLQSVEEREQYAKIHGLTLNQTRSLLNYRGKMADISDEDLFRAMQNVGGPSRMPRDLRDLVHAQLPNGRQPTRAELEQVMARLFMQGTIRRNDAYYYQALREREAARWLPKVHKDEIPAYDADLETMKLEKNPLNRALLKRLRKTGIAMDQK